MPTPTVITDLDPVAANNFPAGSNAPSVLDDVQRAHGGFIRNLLDATQTQEYTAFTTGGTSTAYTLTPNPALTALAANQRFRVKFNAANGANPTLAVSGLAATALKVYDSTGAKIAPAAGLLALNMLTDVEYDGADWVVLNRTDSASTSIIPGYLFGCTLSTAGSSATMSIAAGRATDSTGVQSMALSAIAKTTAAWAVGTAAGGLDAGAIANSTRYYFYVIRRPDTGVTDVVFSLSASTPTLPTNYTQYRYIGSGLTNGSAQWVSFVQVGDSFIYALPVSNVTATNPGTAAVTRTLAVPLRSGITALVGGYISWITTGSALHRIFSFDETDATLDTTNATHRTISTNSVAASLGRLLIRTNSSGQIRTRHSASAGSDELYVNTLGYIDRRGQDA